MMSASSQEGLTRGPLCGTGLMHFAEEPEAVIQLMLSFANLCLATTHADGPVPARFRH